jgi:hypothetical protein
MEAGTETDLFVQKIHLLYIRPHKGGKREGEKEKEKERYMSST